MKFKLSVCLLLSFYCSFAQNEKDKITLSFDNLSMKEAVVHIQETTGYRFFYVDDWLDLDPISKNYNQVSILDLLNDLFEDSSINYYIMEGKKVVLTKGSIIYDVLPETFFVLPQKEFQDSIMVAEIDTEDILPILQGQDQELAKNNIGVVKIGKEDKNSAKRFAILTGYAINTKTQRPISDLALLIKGTGKGTTTNAQGFYTIQVPLGIHQIEVSALGIQGEQKKIIVYGDGQLDFELAESFEVLDEVVVEGNRNRNVEQTIGGVLQIEVKEIKTIPLVLGERDIFKVATTLPGVTTAGEGAAGFNVRGGKTDQNLILLDYAVLYNPSHFFGLFSAINPFTSNNVNIYKGNIPAEHGGRLSSVFDIHTKDGNDQKFSGEASIGPVTGNLTLETPVIKDKSSLLVGGRATYSNWILRSLKEESLKDSEASFFDVIAKYNHKINNNNDVKVMGYYSKDAFNITRDSVYSYSNRSFSLQWNHKFNDNSKGALIFANSQYKFDINFDANSVNDFDLKYNIEESLFKFKMKYLVGATHNFDYGFSGKLYQVKPGSIEPLRNESVVDPIFLPREKGLETAVFISDDFKINEKLSINAGFRYSLYAALGKSSQRIYEDDEPKNENTLIETKVFDDNEVIKTYGGAEARLSARYFLTPSLSVKASYNNTYQYVHTLSNNTTASPTDTWKLSDINIKPQRADQFALGFHKNVNDGEYELSIESYYKKFNNILDYKTGADLLLNEAIETTVLQGQGKSYGVELLMRKNNGRLNGWLGYTYSRSLIKFDGTFEEERINGGQFFSSNFDKPHDLSLVTNYKFNRRFSLSANFVYQTGRPVTYPIGNYVYEGKEYTFYSDRNKFRIPDYYRLDVSFNIEGNHKIKKFAHSFWNISIYNVLGRNNPYSVFFVTENGQIKAYKSSIFSIPIPTITYNFKF
ncbi:TonB-dependent receptor [Flagellimonas pacifica]|uniref:Outer membrane receptor proteins, mostly Fe transport n=1 Tax=Flagellimonas pacifica TaxID=1247520 RepID=A0A285MTI1_9FLAO|nr:carboxypeptidase-like regulatory domain-containing protein [Allomuricauda parva]SNZ00484.1 Outer membrane receptor proteins, mostly Fe transport [Allomuricauda parva]